MMIEKTNDVEYIRWDGVASLQTVEHVYMIPTDRRINGCIDGYLYEISNAIEHRLLRRQDIAFIVLEDGSEEIAVQNENILVQRLQREKCGFGCIHIMPDALKKFVGLVCGDDPQLLQCFKKTGVNYGRIGNLLSLLAVFFGAIYIHRRDSDTALYRTNEQSISPLRAELTFFSCNSSPLSIVGSNYFTATDIDVSLFSSNQECIESIFSLFGLSANTIREKLQLDIPPAITPARWKRIKGGLWPDMGNIAFKNLFRYFAFPPKAKTLGTDYFYLQLGEVLNLPMYLHSLRVNHCINPDRACEEKQIEYYIMLARCVDYYSVYSCLPDNLNLDLICSSDYLADILYLSTEKSASMTNIRRKRLDEYAAIFARLDTPVCSRIVSKINDMNKEIMAENDRGIRDHAMLQAKWETIIQRLTGNTNQNTLCQISGAKSFAYEYGIVGRNNNDSTFT